MKFTIVLLFALVSIAVAQRYPEVFPDIGDEYAASLGGAKVGTYKKVDGYVRNGRGWWNRASEVRGLSLGNAEVGLYGNDRPRNPRPRPLLYG